MLSMPILLLRSIDVRPQSRVTEVNTAHLLLRLAHLKVSLHCKSTLLTFVGTRRSPSAALCMACFNYTRWQPSQVYRRCREHPLEQATRHRANAFFLVIMFSVFLSVRPCSLYDEQRPFVMITPTLRSSYCSFSCRIARVCRGVLRFRVADDAAVGALTKYYSKALSKGADVLDICSSWVSHFPKDWEHGKRTG